MKMSLNNYKRPMDPIERFRTYIREMGLRNTREREMIIREIFSIHDHFDADELFLRLRNRKRIISKASIYRTIPLLIESGLIKEVYFENGHLHYEHIYGHKHHSHLRCVCCGAVLEFAEDEILDIRNRIGKRYGFVLTSHQFELLGYCPACIGEGEAHRVFHPDGRDKTEEGADDSGKSLPDD